MQFFHAKPRFLSSKNAKRESRRRLGKSLEKACPGPDPGAQKNTSRAETTKSGAYSMPLRLMLAATLRKYLPGYDGETGYEVSVEPESTVRDLCRKLAIPEKEVKLIMIEGIAAGLDSVLTGNERVALFPPIGGG
jgi:sulfur carrier protein ThiS